MAFTDTFPAGLVVAAPNGLTSTCGGGTVTAVAGSGNVSLSGASLAGNTSCTISLNVLGTTAGVMTNTTSPVSATESGPGGTASASITVVAPNPPVITKAFGAASIPVNGTTSLTFTIQNPNAAASLSGVAFTDTFPAGLVVAAPNGLTSSCGGVTTAVAGSGNMSLSGGTLAGNASCTISVNVLGTAAGVKTNTTSTVSATESGPGGTATALITVVTPTAPVITKAFGAASIPLNGTTSLTFTIQNPNAATSLTGVAFTDTFPAGLVVAAPNGLTSTCGGGTVTAVAGSGNVSLSGASLAGNANCTISVNVLATSTGLKINTTSAVSATESGPGGTASASINVTGAAALPTVTSVAPNTGPTTGGTTVTIGGTNFFGTTSVRFGGASAASFTVLSGTQITAASPPGNGSVDVTVTTSAGTSALSSADQFTYTTPVDSLKLRALQIAVTKIEAQGSGQAISGAIDNAISDGFKDNGAPVTATDTGMRFNFAAEPQRENAAGERVGDAFASLGYAPRDNVFKAPPRPAPKDWLAWAEIRGTGWSTNVQTGDIRGGQTNALLGLTRRLNPDLLVGLFGGYENFDYTSQLLNGRLKGDGWTAGGYVGWRLLPGLRFDAGLARSGINYDGVAGTAAGTFPGTRWLATGALVGLYRTSPGFEIEPSARIYALWEHENNYIDTLGTLQSARDFMTARASAGAKVAYPLMWSPTVTISPYAGLYADYYFNSDSAAFPAGAILLPTEFIQGLSARVTSGVAIAAASGVRVSIGGEVGGLGSDQFTVWSVRGRASVPF